MLNPHPEFSVYWWDTNGVQHEELRFVGAEAAVKAAHRLAEGPTKALGFVERIIITDGGDIGCFEWIKGKGVTFK